MKKPYVIVLLVIAVAAVGWMYQNATSKAETISTAAAAEKIASDKDIVLLDVRTPAEFVSNTGHLQGAVLIPVQELEQRVDELAPYKDKTIIAYCRTGHRSGNAAGILAKHGFKVLSMSGGITQWNSEQRPVVTGQQ